MSGGATGGGARAGSSGRGVAGGVDTGAATARLPNGGAAILGRLYAGTLPVHPHTDELTGGVIDYLRTAWGTDHLAAPDPHPGYATEAALSGYLTPAAADALFLTQSEADALYLPLSYVPPASGISQADADTRYVNSSGDVMSGILSAPQLNLTIPATGSLYGPVWQTGTSNRWFFGMLGTETGSNAGANLELHRASDTGVDLGTALSLSRATGAATFGGAVTAGGAVTGTGVLTSTGAAGTARGLTTQTAGSNRWVLKMGDEYPETGANAGSQFALYRCDDAGALNGNAVLQIDRASGVATFNYATLFGGNATYYGTGTFHSAATFNSTVEAASSVAIGAAPRAAAGALRLPNAQNLAWRNAANTADLTLGVDASDALLFNGAPIGGGGGGGVDPAGDTMSGTLAFQGSAVDSGGAIEVTGTGVGATGQVFGPSSPAFGTTASASLWRRGVIFTPTTTGLTLTELRWYRLNAGDPTPTSAELWDDVTDTLVWSTSSGLSPLADTAVGWKSVTIPGGSAPAALTSGRNYQLVWSNGTATSSFRASSYSPTATGSLTYVGGITSASGTGIPASPSSHYYFTDVVLGAAGAAVPPAASGALRLPNGTPGLVAWRNAADGADLSLGMDASDRLALAVGAGSLTTSATAGGATALPATPAAYLTVVLNSTTYKIPAFAV